MLNLLIILMISIILKGKYSDVVLPKVVIKIGE